MYVDPVPPLKRELAAELVRIIAGWNRANVAVLMHTDPARVSDLRHGRLDRFSVESLVRFLARMRHHVQVTIVSERELRLRELLRKHDRR
jgi:predicted XRE-type DNA-binding protein